MLKQLMATCGYECFGTSSYQSKPHVYSLNMRFALVTYAVTIQSNIFASLACSLLTHVCFLSVGNAVFQWREGEAASSGQNGNTVECGTMWTDKRYQHLRGNRCLHCQVKLSERAPQVAHKHTLLQCWPVCLYLCRQESAAKTHYAVILVTLLWLHICPTKLSQYAASRLQWSQMHFSVTSILAKLCHVPLMFPQHIFLSILPCSSVCITFTLAPLFLIC
jgi:hypothetical protein